MTQRVPRDKKKCPTCDKYATCVCRVENTDLCTMICLGCGKCLCHPEQKTKLIDGHYIYNGDAVMCIDCYEKHKHGRAHE